MPPFQKAKEIEERFKKEHSDKTLLLLIISGSHFFNLNTPNSDLDFRGIYISKNGLDAPNGEVTYKTNQTGNKNSHDDVDVNFFSLKKYLDLLGRGDFNMIEMLFTPEDKIILTSPLYEELCSIRSSLIIRDISSFLGFIKKEYNRYGIDSNHLGFLQRFLYFLSQLPATDRLISHWDSLKAYASVKENHLKLSETTNEKTIIKTVIIAQRCYQATNQISTIYEAIQNAISKYGERRKSQALHGIEFKGLYHAQRLLYEAYDILEHGELFLPFSKKRHDYLWSIKTGTINPDELFSGIDAQIIELYQKELMSKSNKKEVQTLIQKLDYTYYSRAKVFGLIKK